MNHFTPRETTSIHFAHSAYRLQECFEARDTGISEGVKARGLRLRTAAAFVAGNTLVQGSSSGMA